MFCERHSTVYIFIAGNVAKKRWTSLRDYFQRQHRDMTTFISGSAPSKKKKWPLYDSMSFLVPYISDRPASTNLSSVDDIDLDSTSSQCSTEVPIAYSPAPGEESDSVVGVETPPSTEKCYPSNRAGRKRSAQPHSSIDQEILSTLRTIPTTPVSPRPPQEEDADLLFFKSMLPHVKTLDPLQKMELQAEMHSVLFKHMKRARATQSTTAVQASSSYSYSNEQDNQDEQYPYYPSQ